MPINKEYVPIDNQPTIKPRTVTGIFTRYIAKTLPLAFDESMSYYECLCALLEYINTKVIPALDNNAAGLLELQEFYEKLQTYVNDYFKNLDVQEEINNKLDEMAESGQLTDIIAQYLGLAGMITFDTVADMKQAQNLVNGSKCTTLGYHSVNDNGNAIYKIRTITNEDVIDETSIIALYDNTLIAQLIIKDSVTPEMFGAYGDGIHDDSSALDKCVKANYNVSFKANAIYYLTKGLNLNNKIEGNNAKLLLDENIEGLTNSNYIFVPELNSNILIKNLNIDYIIENESSRAVLNQIQLFHIEFNKSFLMDNCNIYVNATNESGARIDILWTRKGKTNILNSKLENLSNSTSGIGGVLWGTLSGNGNIDIYVNNSQLISKCRDEIIALWTSEDAIVGEKLNALIENSLIKRIYAPNYPSGTLTNIYDTNEKGKIIASYNNCSFECPQQTKISGLLNIGSSISDLNELYVNNCIFNLLTNDIINIFSLHGGYLNAKNLVFNLPNASSVILFRTGETTTYSNNAIIDNCVFNCTSNLKFFNRMRGNYMVKNSKFMTDSSHLITIDSTVDDDTVLNIHNNLFHKLTKIDNTISNGSLTIVLDNNIVETGNTIFNEKDLTLYFTNNTYLTYPVHVTVNPITNLYYYNNSNVDLWDSTGAIATNGNDLVTSRCKVAYLRANTTKPYVVLTKN